MEKLLPNFRMMNSYRASLLLLFSIFYISSATNQEHKCTWKYNISSGMNDERITTCELKGVKYNLMSKQVPISILSNENEIKENIRVKFSSKL